MGRHSVDVKVENMKKKLFIGSKKIQLSSQQEETFLIVTRCCDLKHHHYLGPELNVNVGN